MSWLLFALGTIVLWSIVNIIDKHVITDELKDPYLCTVIYGGVFFLIFSTFTLIFGSFALPLKFKLLAMAIGAIFLGGIFLYYKSLQYEEVSRVIPVFALGALFVLAFAILFLGERLSALKLLGILQK